MSVAFSPTLQLLRNHFPAIVLLRDYLAEICDSSVELEKVGDSERYLSLLNTSYVALDVAVNVSPVKKFSTGHVMSEIYEVIDRVQIRLFELGKGKSSNILTRGYRRADDREKPGRADMSRQAITNFFPNTNITALQAIEWKILLQRTGEAAMYHLLLNTSIFVALPNESFCQLVGTPVTELKPLPGKFLAHHPQIHGRTPDHQRKRSMEQGAGPKKSQRLNKPGMAVPVTKGPISTAGTAQKPKHTAADISFIRARIFYSRPAITTLLNSAHRTIAVGLPPSHVLNRLAPIKMLKSGGAPSEANVTERDIRHVLKYIFPRQFGLRNPFEPTPAQRPNAYKYEDHMFREDEIEARGSMKTPKRLKPMLELVHKLIIKHWKCNYRAIRSLLRKLNTGDRQPLDSSIILQIMSETSRDVTNFFTQVSLANISADSHPSLIYDHGASVAEKVVKAKPKFAEFICSHNEVFRFVLKVTSTVIPSAFWGCNKNFKAVMKHVEKFVKSRRFETTTLHSVLQNFSTQECDWLLPGNPVARNQRPSVTDSLKRRELIEEFLYWYFEGFVIPLIRTTFYATESNAFRYRVLYFRQDDWMALCRPLLNRLTTGTFERLDEREAKAMLKDRKLGYSFVRLLPKETGVRPIVNLRRKFTQCQSDGSPALSINQILQAAFQILTYEKITRPSLLGASVFGSNETYAKLKAFKTRLLNRHGTLPKLYFVKVDVRTCFDSIDQGKLLEILHDILSEDGYMIQRYSQLVCEEGKVKKTFQKKAHPEADHPHFLTYATKLAGLLRHTLFIDQVVYFYEDREEILQLLKMHVTENIVKIGPQFFRQTVGIPQGSVLSTILCNFFYGDLERKMYKFTEDEQNMLCRFIDDYLFVTTEESQARKFLDMMNGGHPDYGCFISPEKTLTNFYVNEQAMNTLPGQQEFPWCGYSINMKDLSISTDYTRYFGTHIGDTVTVDRGRRPGATFANKMLQLTKRKSHIIYTDMTLSTERIVYRNVYENFVIAAMKMHCYIRDWGIDLSRSGNRKFVLGTIHKIIRSMYSKIRNKACGSLARDFDGRSNVKEVTVTWLGTHAFRTVLACKPGNGCGLVAKALEFDLRNSRFAGSKRRWGGVVKEAKVMIENIRF